MKSMTVRHKFGVGHGQKQNELNDETIKQTEKLPTWPLFDLQPEALVLAEQIPDLLVVNFEVGDPDQELDVVVGLGDVAENVREAVWNDAWKFNDFDEALL